MKIWETHSSQLSRTASQNSPQFDAGTPSGSRATTFVAEYEKRFGKKGVVDLTGINAYYTLLAMQLNAAEYDIPKDGKKLPRFPR